MTKNGQTMTIACLFSLLLASLIHSRPAMSATMVLGSLLIIDGIIFLFIVSTADRLEFSRKFGQGTEHGVVFCNKEIEAKITITNQGKLGIQVEFQDTVPSGIEIKEPSNNNYVFCTTEPGNCHTNQIPGSGSGSFNYRVKAGHMSTFQFPGITWTVTSPGGLWREERFVPLKGSLRVVPDIFGKIFLQPWHKGKNILLRHGRHQQRRAGLGAELLSLRTYQAGDPIKTIAWRASARKDKLLTKEFENEVPVRARILFQPATRFRMGKAPAITNSVTFLARVAKILVESRDLVEFISPLPGGSIRTGLGLTRKHLGKILNAMGEVITLPDSVPGTLPANEQDQIFREAFKYDPELKRAASLLMAHRFRLSLFMNEKKTAVTILSLFLASCFDLGTGAIPILENNSNLLGFFARKFASSQGIHFNPPEEAAVSWALIESSRWGVKLYSAMDRLIRQARDEELYIIMADFAILTKTEKERFLQLLRKGRALGHRFVIYWPSIPDPGGPLQPFYNGATMETRNFQHSLRGLNIPAKNFSPMEGFLTILKELKLLKKGAGVRSW